MAGPADKTAAGFTFYHGYLAVVYGVVATDGLELLGDKSTFGLPQFLLLFFGVFAIGLHFWFVCSTVDESTHTFYRVLAGDSRAYLFFFVDAMFATAFAWLVLAMFHGVPSRGKLLLRWFLVAAVLSLAYDVYSQILVSMGRRSKSADDDSRKVISNYNDTVKAWLFQDSLFVAGALLLLLLDHVAIPGVDLYFAVVALVVLALDVNSAQQSTSGNSS
ncbi:MAG TPA: hypothetical protein VMD78_10685 [Candidatus Baltobacteraceae bacterium]|nr:hypothetical protein [Candidatus Baltobacteraceae bacterium]